MKNLIILLLIGAFACSESKISPKNKVSITFGNIKHGDWIQIDDLPQLPHRLDTMRFKDLPDGSIFVRSNYPQLFPMEDLIDYLWISQRWTIGLISNRWLISGDGIGGVPSYSLYYHLVNVRRIGNFYDKISEKSIYKITFKNFGKQEDFFAYEREAMIANNFAKITTIIIERLDGKPIKIQTSEGYDAKIEYQ
ncbi:hypothetical protein [Thermoflexibacter ruber]|uniref:Lipoprotein n=1 Tax=Thermoflexibacter ruber TaxID=1003 RepID=A0A1I2D302_9BACT|nr:hypothetical protein [Thermoflexibacter ruber]SFE74889.1 hypothetical protein SAMN04488541_100641 [Thermoflexibacter ruber]